MTRLQPAGLVVLRDCLDLLLLSPPGQPAGLNILLLSSNLITLQDDLAILVLKLLQIAQ